MILWHDGPHGPAENMARDTALLAAAATRPQPVLRLFRFEPRGITLGYAQRPAAVLDLDRCAAAGVPWAVRPTGGRAIFHAEEWTYALAARLDDPRWGGDLRQSGEAVARLLVGALRRLGVAAGYAAGTRAPARSDGGAVAAPCFASTARNEIVLRGRKLVGSAQRRTANALLQQGSVLLGPGHLRLADFLALDDAHRDAERARLEQHATHAGEVLGGNAPLDRWADAIEAGIPGVRRFDGVAGAWLLTPDEPGSYTASPRNYNDRNSSWGIR